MKVIKLRPRNAKTLKQMCSLRSDFCGTRNSWIVLDYDNVHIHNQNEGQPSTGHVTLTHTEFNRFIDWYNREQVCAIKSK